jgi:osmotically inducible protein OsmC
MPIRKGSAVWEGSFREGKGTVRVEGLFEGPYSFSTRFENAEGTNPEELIAAAHASCFSMALSALLSAKRKPPRRIETTAEVQIEPVGQGFRITTSKLHTTAEVPDISEEDFLKAADEAKTNCPVSQALTGVRISLEAKLKK